MSRKRGRSPAARRPPEPLFAEEQRALNRAFYAAEPADYFQLRLRRLVQFAASTDAEERAEEGTYQFGNLQMTVPSVADEPADEEAREPYVAIEAEMLVHHVSETVLRMYVAHRSAPAVPWVEVSKLRGLGQFKAEVEKLTATELDVGRRADIGYLWTGHRVPPTETRAAEEWERAVDRIEPYLLHFGEILLSRAGLYNAAKHGLGVQPGDRKMSLEGMPSMSAEGPSLAWLDQTETEDGRFWVVRNRWLNPQLDAALVFAGAQLLRGLWDIARVRYLDWPVPPQVPLPVALDQVLAVSRQNEEGITLEEVAMPPTIFSPLGSGADARLSKRQARFADGSAGIENPDVPPNT